MSDLNDVKAAIEDRANEIKGVVEGVRKAHETLDGVVKTIGDQIGEHGKELETTKNDFQAQVEKVSKLESTLDDLVEKMVQLPNEGKARKSVGELAAEAEVCKNYQGGHAVLLQHDGPLFAKDITSGGASAGATIEPYVRPGIQTEPNRAHIVRDLLITLTIATNSVEWVRELVFTNNAAPQAGEGAAKAKSDITFEKQNSPVQTIAHWIAASRQVLADSRSLASFINNRLIYGLQFEEEDQLLLGDGTGNNLHGLVPQATAYNTGLDVSGDTKIDQLRRALLQVSLNKYMANAIVLNPTDWCDLELTKTSDNAYLFSNPVNPGEPRLWGKRVVEGLSMTAGQFLLGDMARAATLWDREMATIRVSEHHADFFVENMVAVLCEERLALTVEHPLGLVTGTLAATP